MVSSENDDIGQYADSNNSPLDNFVRTEDEKTRESGSDGGDQVSEVDPFCHKIEMPTWMW